MLNIVGGVSVDGSCGRHGWPVSTLMGIVFSIGMIGNARADTDYISYQERIKSYQDIMPLPGNPFGERMDYYKGSISFFQEDVVLVGIGPEIVVGRSYNQPAAYKTFINGFADWEISIPRIETYSLKSPVWNMSATDAGSRCSGISAYPKSGGVPWNMWWNGYQLIDSKGEVREILGRDSGNTQAPAGNPAAYPIVTQSMWQISCLSTTANDAGGEAFLATTPDGTKYWFNWLVVTSGGYKASFDTGAPEPITMNVRKAAMLVTRIEDRFGNFLTYNYSGDMIQSITGSDGRQVDFSWNGDGNEIVSVTTGSRTWNYSYQSLSDHNGTAYNSLTAVTEPDLSSYQFSLSGLYDAVPKNSAFTGCGIDTSTFDNKVSGSITGPSGLVATYQLAQTHRGRSNVPYRCDNNGANLAFSPVYDVFSLMKRTYSGPAVNTSWSYAYGDLNASFDSTCTTGCVKTVTLDETDPAGVVNRYTFSNEWSAYEGNILSLVNNLGGDGGQSTFSYAYADTTGMTYPATLGSSYNPEAVNELPLTTYTPRQSVTVSQDGVTFNATANGYDVFAQPIGIVKSSSLGYSKITLTQYLNDTAQWVIGLVASQADNNTGLVEKSITYTAKSEPSTITEFGKLKQGFTYSADGMVATSTDGNNNITTYSSWKRDVPQSIQYADGTAQLATVDEDGWISSVTDEEGYTTSYTYDAMGRLASIVYPGEDSSVWNATTQVFEPINAEEYGVPSGHWRKTVTTGSNRKLTYYDALWQPLLTRQYDAANETGTQHFQRLTYDQLGRVTFASYPGASDTLTAGTWTGYDALGRTASVSQDSELGLLTTLTEYLSGLTTRVTDPKGFQTVTSYMAYDKPTYDWPVLISQPEGSSTDIGRDTFGKPLSITRRDATGSVALTRTYVYQPDYQTLCKIIEPETVTTVMDYDNAGNLAWSTGGLDLPSTTECNLTEAYGAGRRIDRTYDARNRLKTLTLPDGKGDQGWTYTADGLPAQISVVNPNVSAPITDAYTYNRRRLLIGETTQIAGVQLGLSHTYDANGHLSSQTYPSGLVVDYAPNALGQPTQAGTFASGVTYYPNGAIESFTYGNGIVHKMSQNARQLPSQSTDCTASGTCSTGDKRLDLAYVFDESGNVSSITDGVDGRQNQSMIYDGLDRLSQATSNMFGTASYSYDVLDNLTRVQLSGGQARDQYYCYDSHWRLANVMTGSCAGTTVVGLAYDVQGNLANKNGQVYAFDYGNRLRSVAGKEWYAYDGQGRRVLSCNPTACDYQLYASDGKLYYHQDNRAAKDYDNVYLGDSLVAIREVPTGSTAATVLYQHTNALGTPIAVTDANKALAQTSEYEPYGQLLNRTLTNGPGFTGHVQDAATGLTYMQQRYYDPMCGCFLSVDPVQANPNTGANFGRYVYANNNPYKFVDPDGRNGELFWTAPDRVTVTFNYAMTGVNPQFTPAQLNAQVAQNFSGNVTVGNVNVTVTAQAVQVTNPAPGQVVNVVNIVPNTAGVTQSGRSETNAIGGNQVTLGASGPQAATAVTGSHEVGHGLGAGDQYAGGLGVNGQTLQADVPGAANIMKDLSGANANSQSLGEVIRAPTNVNKCAQGVSAASGGC